MVDRCWQILTECQCNMSHGLAKVDRARGFWEGLLIDFDWHWLLGDDVNGWAWESGPARASFLRCFLPFQRLSLGAQRLCKSTATQAAQHVWSKRRKSETFPRTEQLRTILVCYYCDWGQRGSLQPLQGCKARWGSNTQWVSMTHSWIFRSCNGMHRECVRATVWGHCELWCRGHVRPFLIRWMLRRGLGTIKLTLSSTYLTQANEKGTCSEKYAKKIAQLFIARYQLISAMTAAPFWTQGLQWTSVFIWQPPWLYTSSTSEPCTEQILGLHLEPQNDRYNPVCWFVVSVCSLQFALVFLEDAVVSARCA